MVLTSILGSIGKFAVNTISSLGYFGVFFLMVLESMVVPIPSELVMPFAGYLIATGNFTWLGVLIASAFGSIVGSLISYYIGLYGGEKILSKYGKYLLLDMEDLKNTENWFRKKGEATIFIGRMIPVVRHLISIPAGVAKMDKKKFIIFTVTGATIWNMFLTYLGYVLGKNWAVVRQYSEPFSIGFAILIVAGVVYFVWHHLLKHKKKKNKDNKK